jgi:hypothetical protein
MHKLARESSITQVSTFGQGPGTPNYNHFRRFGRGRGPIKYRRKFGENSRVSQSECFPPPGRSKTTPHHGRTWKWSGALFGICRPAPFPAHEKIGIGTRI